MSIRREQQLPVIAAPLVRRFGLLAETLEFRTNDERLLAAADASFGRFTVPPPDGRDPLVVQLVVDRGADAGGAAVHGRPAYRTVGDLVLVSHGAADVASIDVVRGTASGFVCAATAADAAFVRYAFIEAMALSMLSRCRGYLTLHAAGIVSEGNGIALLGPAGSGKSTLAIAAARRGHAVFAEDAVFVRPAAGGLELWGLPWTQRLLPDAGSHFPELAGLQPRRQPNAELKIELDLDTFLPGRAVPCARASALVSLTRGGDGPSRWEPLPAGTGIDVLWPYDGGWTAVHDATATSLGTLPAYRLHNDGTPDQAVDALEELCATLDP